MPELQVSDLLATELYFEDQLEREVIKLTNELEIRKSMLIKCKLKIINYKNYIDNGNN